MVQQASEFDGKKADDILEWPSKLHVSLSLYHKSIFNIVQGFQRSSELENDKVTARDALDKKTHTFYSILYVTTSDPVFSVVRRFEKNAREEGVGNEQDSWAALREKFDSCSREALRLTHLEMETVKMRSDENLDDFLYKQGRAATASIPSPPRRAPRTSSKRTLSWSTFHQSTK